MGEKASLIMLFGRSATGKGTLAERLADALHVEGETDAIIASSGLFLRRLAMGCDANFQSLDWEKDILPVAEDLSTPLERIFAPVGEAEQGLLFSNDAIKRTLAFMDCHKQALPYFCRQLKHALDGDHWPRSTFLVFDTRLSLPVLDAQYEPSFVFELVASPEIRAQRQLARLGNARGQDRVQDQLVKLNETDKWEDQICTQDAERIYPTARHVKIHTDEKTPDAVFTEALSVVGGASAQLR